MEDKINGKWQNRRHSVYKVGSRRVLEKHTTEFLLDFESKIDIAYMVCPSRRASIRLPSTQYHRTSFVVFSKPLSRWKNFRLNPDETEPSNKQEDK